ncbi:MAG: peptidoglycan editing factor PgeF [Pseudomonadota bacterium]
MDQPAAPADLKPLKSATLESLNCLTHGFFGRLGGVSTPPFEALNAGPLSGDTPADVAENRRRIRTALGVQAMVSLRQVHGRRVVDVKSPWPDGALPEGDALVTDRSDVALCILTADCAPVLFADIRLPVIAAAHAGWRGALAGVCEATLERMAAYGSRPRDVVAVIGPAIAQASYEVGPDLRAAALSADPTAGTYFAEGRGDRLQFDLPGYVHHRLGMAGVGWIEHVGGDTYASDGLFSYRRATHAGAAHYGRNASVIAHS